MRLIDLQEGRDAPLYHGTSMMNFIAIMATNELSGSDPMDDIGITQLSVRLTRDLSMGKKFAHLDRKTYGGILVLDQTKLAQNYKMFPFSDNNIGATRDTNNSESEEVVVTDNIFPLSKFLTGYYATPEDILQVTDSQSSRDEIREYILADRTDIYIKTLGQSLVKNQLRLGDIPN